MPAPPAKAPARRDGGEAVSLRGRKARTGRARTDSGRVDGVDAVAVLVHLADPVVLLVERAQAGRLLGVGLVELVAVGERPARRGKTSVGRPRVAQAERGPTHPYPPRPARMPPDWARSPAGGGPRERERERLLLMLPAPPGEEEEEEGRQARVRETAAPARGRAQRRTSSRRPGLASLGLAPGTDDLGLVRVLLEGGLAGGRVARRRADVAGAASARVLRERGSRAQGGQSRTPQNG